MAIERIEIMGAVLELPARQLIYLQDGPNWQCCLAGSSKTASRISIFSIGMGAKYSFYVKSITSYAPPPFLMYNNLVLAIVNDV